MLGRHDDSKRVETVATALSHEQTRIARVGLDLLPQPIDMRLERVRCDVGVVAPNLIEQNLPSGLAECQRGKET